MSARALRPLREARLVYLPRISDPRGALTFAESRRGVPFGIRRVYWVYDVPGGGDRSGGHAYHATHELIIALSGSFDVTVDDGAEQRTFTLNRSHVGLHVPPTLWRRIGNFATNAVCFVAASTTYDAGDYLRDHELFQRWRAGAEDA